MADGMEEEAPPLTQELFEQELELARQELEIWCLIVGMIGTAFPVTMKGTDRVWELQKTIKNVAVEIFGDYNAAQLQVYLAKNDTGEWLTASEVAKIENGDIDTVKGLFGRGHLVSMTRLAAIFSDIQANVVHILVPLHRQPAIIQVEAEIAGKRKRSEELLDVVETIDVSIDELNDLFDVMSQKKQSKQTLIVTSSLDEFLRGYGGFPSSYLVRKEEQMLWRIVLRLLLKKDNRISIVGSSGVGKSCFLMLIGFYLSFVKKRKVLVVRRLNNTSELSSVVYLDGDNNTCIKKAKLKVAEVLLLPDRYELRGAIILIDGYSQAALKYHFELLPYQLIASAGEAGYTSYELDYEVVLPAWRFDDLLHYSEWTPHEWNKLKSHDQKNKKCLRNFATEQYFYSGGNLRDFCRDRTDVKNDFDRICGSLCSAQAINIHQQGIYWSRVGDRIRRHYVVDLNDEEHYWLASCWRLEIDSGYVLKRLGRFMDLEMQISLFQIAQDLRAGYQGSAFKQCFHGAIRRSTKRYPLHMINVVINSDPSSSNQRYDRLILHGPPVVCEGNTEEECYETLSRVFDGAYCHFDSVNFSFVEAVAMCKGVVRGSNSEENVVAMISPTISTSRYFKPKLWEKLNKALDRNEHLLDSIPRVYVAVGPDASTCKIFNFVDVPGPGNFMVCCFDPLQHHF